jgi:hypothetical protein
MPNADTMTTAERPPLTNTPGVDFYDTLATPKQMAWVRKLPNGEQAARERFGVPVEHLTKRQAYELISEHDLRKGNNV